MGDNSKTDNKVVGEGFEITAVDTEDTFVFMSTGSREIFGVKISVEVCCEERLEDRRIDLLTELQEALDKTMVGMYKLTKKAHIQEYNGTFRLTDREFMEGTRKRKKTHLGVSGNN